MSISRKKVHRFIYIFSLALIIASIPLSKVTMQWGETFLVLNWIAEGGLRIKMINFFKNKIALVISSLYILHLIGLIWTTDFHYAFYDLGIKVPLLGLPLVIATSTPLDKKVIYNFLLLFVVAVIASTLVCMYYLFTLDYTDIREISHLLSHIRLSLMICFSLFILMYFIYKKISIVISGKTFSPFLIYVIIICWLLVFLVILQSITGLVILFIASFIFALYASFRIRNRLYKTSAILLLIAVPVCVLLYIGSIYREFIANSALKNNVIRKTTALGNPYSHDTLNTETENGYYIYRNINEDELEQEWNKRSNFKYDATDRKGQDLRFTLIHFLASKGYDKDAEAMRRLTTEEIHAVEKGITNINYLHTSLRSRIYEIIWEVRSYFHGASPNACSVMQRLEYWKASILILSSHPFLGVGTGDIYIAFDRQYDLMKSRLDKKFRWLSHNQYLRFAATFGLFGLLWFLFTLIFPFFTPDIHRNFIYIAFFIIITLSMLTEDTIESQTGLTFFAFFNTFLLLARKESY